MEAGTAETGRGRRRAAPTAFSVLAERFDAEVIDVRADEVRIRLGVDGSGEWDALISGGEMRLRAADHDHEPDATIRADAASWEQIAGDVRGGMERLPARPARRCAATSTSASASSPRRAASTDPGPAALRRASRRETGTISRARGRDRRPPLICLHGLGGTKASFMPTVSAASPSTTA